MINNFVSTFIAISTVVASNISYSDAVTKCFGENPYYHVGDTFSRSVKIYYQEYFEYDDEFGVFRSDSKKTDITNTFTDSLEGVVFSESGSYVETLNGEYGLFRLCVNVYEYGDVDGDFSITVSDAVIMSRIIAEDDSVNTDYIFNADTNSDSFIDIFDLKYIIDYINI